MSRESFLNCVSQALSYGYLLRIEPTTNSSLICAIQDNQLIVDSWESNENTPKLILAILEQLWLNLNLSINRAETILHLQHAPTPSPPLNAIAGSGKVDDLRGKSRRMHHKANLLDTRENHKLDFTLL